MIGYFYNKYFIVIFHHKYNCSINTSLELVPPIQGLESFKFDLFDVVKDE